MAIAVIAFTPGGTAEQEALTLKHLNLAASPVAGVTARLAGPRAGGWQVISVWETQEAWESFQHGRLEPALQQAGVPIPTFEIWSLSDVRLMPRQG